jgi:hypothetical protein
MRRGLLGVSALLALWGCEPQDGADPSGDDAVPIGAAGDVSQIDIEVAESDWAQLTMQGVDFLGQLTGPECLSGPFTKNYEWYPSTATVRGERVEQMGVRKKGFLGSSSTSRPSLKLDSDRFVDEQFLADGTEHITLNNMQQDPSRIRTCLAYAVFQRAGLPAPGCDFSKVSVNGEDFGIYANIQPVKKPYIADHFEDDGGDLYEGTISDFTEDYVVTFEPKNDDTDPDLQPLYGVVDALTVSDDALMDSLGAVLDIDAFISFWAVESLLSHWDGYAQGRNNFYVYRDPTSDRLHFLPWGADAVFENAEANSVHTGSTLSSRLWNHPDTRAAYLAESQRLLDEVWDEAWLRDEADRLADRIAADVLDAGAFEATMGMTRAFIEGRRAVIQDMIDSGGPERPVIDQPKYCMEPIANVHAEFDLTWTNLLGDPFEADASLSVDYDDEAAAFIAEGALAGTDGMSDLVLVAGLDPSGTTITYAIIVLPPSISPGTYDVDLSGVVGVMASMDLTSGAQEPTIWGYIGGEVTFEDVGIEAGDAIRGTLDGYVVPAFFDL